MKFFNTYFLKILIPLFVLIFLLSPQIALGRDNYLINFKEDSLTDAMTKFQAASEYNSGLKKIDDSIDMTADAAGITSKQKASLPALLGQIINYSFGIIGTIFMLMTLLGGLFWMTAGGNEEKVGKAKGFIMNGINGMIVIFLAYTLVYVILAALKNVGT